MAVAVSIFLHGLALADWWPVTWLSPTSERVGAIVRGSQLTVLLDNRHESDISPVKSSGAQVSSLIGPPDVPQRQPHSEQRHAQGVVPAIDEFLTKDRLSVPAQPLTDIHIPWPLGLPIMGVKSAVFTIFIDELGIVKDVVPDGRTLLPVMEEVVRDTFLAAKFRPALLNGRAVKSMKRIEVEFEFLPTQEPQDVPEVVSRKELSN